MSKWEENVRKVIPYTPGEQPAEKNVIKLNTNENPYPPSPMVSVSDIEIEELRKYPDPAASVLVRAIADYHNVKAENIFVGVGSDDVIAMAFMTFFNSEKPILFPDITYSFYPVWAEMLGIPYETKPLDEAFRIIVEDYKTPNGGIIFPNPNAPTGVLLAADDVEAIVKANPDSVVIIDEAYIDFGGESVLPLIDRYDNLLVIRTFSKSRSMAGMRIGYAAGCKKLISYMNDVKYSYNSYTMNVPSIIWGTKSIKDDEYFRDITGRIIKTREWFREELISFGFTVLPSAANFLFAAHEEIPAERIMELAKDSGIYFRHFGGERIGNYLRITIGTDEDMHKVADFLRHILMRSK